MRKTHQNFAPLEYKISIWNDILKTFLQNFHQSSITGIIKKIGIHSVLFFQIDFSHSLQFLYTFVNNTLCPLFPK